MTDGRKRISSVIAALGIATLGGSVLTIAPSYAEPDIDDVEARVDKLFHEAEQASERYNDARVELQETQARLKALRADLDRQRAKVDTVREQVATSVVSQYQDQAFSSATQVFLSQDPDAFLDQLATVSNYNDQQAQMMADFATQVKQLELREEAAKRELAEIAETKKTLAEEKAEIDAKAGEAEDLLGDMEAEARAEAASRSETRQPVANVSVSGRAGAAVDYAMAQVGDAYVYGAAGPDAFDCSGLTMMAWQQAGVSLPHSSSGQMSSGPSVSQSELMPGDLVFYYSPVSHVGMYIGNGQIVHAANPESGVEVVDVNSMPYSGAVRPG
ncbi:MAG TPA: NlpC/P60 family protein [Nocardioidaceae bacterium]|nr:NlpC/P60 family protein [Nocardioidaceae bacterium]